MKEEASEEEAQAFRWKVIDAALLGLSLGSFVGFMAGFWFGLHLSH